MLGAHEPRLESNTTLMFVLSSPHSLVKSLNVAALALDLLDVPRTPVILIDQSLVGGTPTEAPSAYT